MDEETQRRALDPFFTTKKPGEGSGLGLYLASSSVRSFGGKLQLSSKVGQGTTVSVWLPRAEPPAEERASERTGSGKDVPGPRRILVVDDEPHIRRALRRILRRRHSVSEASSGASALKLFAAGERFDVVLSDVLMPDGTGIELYQALEQDYPEQATRVRFVTGGSTTDEARSFVEEHRERVILKPFDAVQIDQAIEEVLHTRGALGEASRSAVEVLQS